MSDPALSDLQLLISRVANMISVDDFARCALDRGLKKPSSANRILSHSSVQKKKKKKKLFRAAEKAKGRPCAAVVDAQTRERSSTEQVPFARIVRVRLGFSLADISCIGIGVQAPSTEVLPMDLGLGLDSGHIG